MHFNYLIFILLLYFPCGRTSNMKIIRVFSLSQCRHRLLRFHFLIFLLFYSSIRYCSLSYIFVILYLSFFLFYLPKNRENKSPFLLSTQDIPLLPFIFSRMIFLSTFFHFPKAFFFYPFYESFFFPFFRRSLFPFFPLPEAPPPPLPEALFLLFSRSSLSFSPLAKLFPFSPISPSSFFPSLPFPELVLSLLPFPQALSFPLPLFPKLFPPRSARARPPTTIPSHNGRRPKKRGILLIIYYVFFSFSLSVMSFFRIAVMA